MIAADREWQGTDAASPQLLKRLRKVLPADLPPEYFQLLAFSNGGEGPLPVEPYNFRLDEGEYAAEQYVDKVLLIPTISPGCTDLMSPRIPR